MLREATAEIRRDQGRGDEACRIHDETCGSATKPARITDEICTINGHACLIHEVLTRLTLMNVNSTTGRSSVTVWYIRYTFKDMLDKTHAAKDMPDKTLASRKDLLWYLQVILFGSLILYLGKSLFIPLSFAILISFVLYPVCAWMEEKGIGRLWAIVWALILLFIITLALLALLASQMVSFINEWPVIQVKLQHTIVNLSGLLADVFNIGVARQKEIIANLANQSGAGVLNMIRYAVTSSVSSVVLFVLIPVYAVLILLYRTYWMKVLGRLFPHEPSESLREIVSQSVQAYFKFIRGMIVVYLVVGCLNSVGLALLGIPNAILFGLIASVLTVVPYVGIVVGALLPMAVAWVTYDAVWYPLGVIGIFSVVQYLEANVIFPVAVSHRLNINTLMMLLVILAGGLIWGLAGMILFVPFAGILKLVADRNPKWKTVSMILGTDKPV